MNITSLPVSQREHIMWVEVAHEPAHITFARFDILFGPFGVPTPWADVESVDETDRYYKEFRP